MASPKTFAQSVRPIIVLPFLIAALLGLGFGFHANATSPAHVSTSAQHLIAIDDPPPGH